MCFTLEFFDACRTQRSTNDLICRRGGSGGSITTVPEHTVQCQAGELFLNKNGMTPFSFPFPCFVCRVPSFSFSWLPLFMRSTNAPMILDVSRRKLPEHNATLANGTV
ncbi:unnamed protein product [Ixodes pacificus]